MGLLLLNTVLSRLEWCIDLRILIICCTPWSHSALLSYNQQINLSSGGLHSTEVLSCFSPSSPRFESRNFFIGKIIDVAEVNQQRWLEESGQWLENVDQTYLVLARGKPALQKEKNRGLIP